MNKKREINGIDVERLYEVVAKRRGVCVDEVKKELDDVLDEAWDDKKGTYKKAPDLDAFADVIAAYVFLKNQEKN